MFAVTDWSNGSRINDFERCHSSSAKIWSLFMKFSFTMQINNSSTDHWIETCIVKYRDVSTYITMHVVPMGQVFNILLNYQTNDSKFNGQLAEMRNERSGFNQQFWWVS